MWFSKWTFGILWIFFLVEQSLTSQENKVENIKEEKEEPDRHKRSFNQDILNIPKHSEDEDILSRQKRTVDGGQMEPLPMTRSGSGGNQDPSRDYQHGSGVFNYQSPSQGSPADELEVDSIESRVFVNPRPRSNSHQQTNQRRTVAYSRQSQGQGQRQGQGVSGSQGQRSQYQIFPRRTRTRSRTQYLEPVVTGSQSQQASQRTVSNSNNAGRTGYTNSGTPYYVAQGAGAGGSSQVNSRQNQYPAANSGNRYYINPSVQGGGSGYRTVTSTQYRTVNPVGGGTRQGGGYVSGGRSHFVPNTGVISNDPNCPSEGYRVYIDNMDCNQAVDTLGTFICYNYERVSRECCQKCLSLKRANNMGCEYGDRSNQCRNLESFLCYEPRNRQICCETCQRYRQQHRNSPAGCQFGDRTPRCNDIRTNQHLCYLPENQRLCCVTCPQHADRTKPECQWGDQNPTLCELYGPDGALRINCYQPSVRQVCCDACQRLQSRFRGNIAGCQYGDRPVTFSTTRGLLTCRQYVRQFGMEVCDFNDVATHCCYTCHQYRQSRRRGVAQG